MERFTHLNVASAYSAHHGTSHPEALVEAAHAAGAEAAAITDRDGIYGAVRHIRACLAAGLAPVVGVNLQVRAEGELSEVSVLAHGQNAGAGWAGLVRLISAAHSPRRRGLRSAHGTAHRDAWITPEQAPLFLLGENGPTSTVLLGPRSEVGSAVLAGDPERARRLLSAWEARMPGGVALEVVCHYAKPGQSGSLQHAAAMARLAHSAGIPAVLTNAVRYLTPDDALTGDVLDSAAQLLPLGAYPPQPNGQAWLKPAGMMRRMAFQIAEYAGLGRQFAVDLLSRTEETAERCRLDPDADLRWRQPKVPELEVLGLAGQDPAQVLRQRCEAAVLERYPAAGGAELTRIRERLEMELSTIGGFGFETYFLTVAEVVALIRGMGVRAQARGSGAGSLVNYLLRIGSVDPLEHDLLFERFLGTARSTLPDIDIDIESARRHEVYRAVFERFGHHRTTLLSMQNAYRARGAVRDAGQALSLGEEQITQIAESLWRYNARDLRAALSTKPELRDVAAQIASEPRLDLLVDLSERLDRLPRHISMHPCGVILGDSTLLSVTPTQPSGIGLPMAQLDKDDIDDMGLIKIDILGVRMQSALAYAVGEIARVNGPEAAVAGGLPADAPYVSADGTVDLDSIPHDDEPTFQLIRSTHTLGCFQIESPGQRSLLGRLQPDQYEDLIADISLFRPGPMKSNMVAPFIRAKHSSRIPNVLHERFRPFLSESYGVVIYHEQVLRIFAETMDISLTEADELRRSLSREGERIEADFRARAGAKVDADGRRVYTDRDVESIWETLRSFGSFGFCKAHGAAFALPTYQSAWLKAHYPVEFLTGVLEHDPGMYPRRLLMAEARRMGIPILPLDVNRSLDRYRAESLGDAEGSKGIRLSLKDIKGIQAGEVQRLVAGQPYSSITDVYHRAQPSRPLMLQLAQLGAFDSLTSGDAQGARRGSAIAYVRQLTARSRVSRPQAPRDQLALLSERDLMDASIPDPSQEERTALELDLLSTEVSEHLIESYRPLLDELGVTRASELASLRHKSPVLVAGMRVATQTPPMRSGRRTVFISVDDGTGVIDTTFFEEAQERTGPVLFGTQLLLIQGTVSHLGERDTSILAEEAKDLKAVWAQWSALRRGRSDDQAAAYA
ncbi:DNA polymerase III subunit alpha [Falsarthrobacter nasiphocae]|uniref:DNA-directed DNA polymerase n=1 Tax=Falsarthrobacter nasiphocae TaxID=189863 RepID=A0AAE4C5K8_9MICC|nr:DNA polymerase III subunit alpha [Falsarthrobacter nasiphocae]MDR6891608.1 error-prone DNA polymerase [Falsarthrobacter nasiphocae]